MKNIIYFFEYIIVFLIFFLFRLLPLNISAKFASFLFSTFGKLSGANKTAIKNCKYVFPNMKEKEVKSIVKKSWDNLGRTISELPRLNYLFDKLAITKDQQEIETLTNQIWKIWHEIDDPKMTRAFETGVQMMNLGFHSRAIDYFDKVIMEIPNFAEAWNKRATAHFMMGNFDLSMRDISKTLELEPRHFGALDGMGLIFIHLNQPEKAIDIYDKMLEIFPNSNSTKMKKDRILSLTTQST